MHPQLLQLQASFRALAKTGGWHAPHDATLTMKQARQVESKSGLSYEKLDAPKAYANMRHFLNRLNQHIYGKAAQRYGKKVFIIPVLEGMQDKRLHYHAVIDCPRDDLLEGYPELIASMWEQTPWGYKNNLVRAESDDGWTKYITKLHDKSNYADSMDWDNFHV